MNHTDDVRLPYIVERIVEGSPGGLRGKAAPPELMPQYPTDLKPRPGDELLLVVAAEGLLLYQHSTDPLTARWWGGLGEDERRQARAEAERYESLSEEERDRIWEGRGGINRGGRG